MATLLTLPPLRPDAPILKFAVAHAEYALQRLQKVLGDGGAQGVTVDSLKTDGPQLPGAGELHNNYKTTAEQAKLLETDMNTLDAQVADIAAKSAEVANTVTAQVSDVYTKVTAIITGINDMLDQPSIGDQLTAAGKIEKTVGDAQNAVDQAYDQLQSHADDVNASPFPGADDGAALASPNGYSTPVSPSGDYSGVTNNGGADRSTYTPPIYPWKYVKGSHKRLDRNQLTAVIHGALDYLGITDPLARKNWTDGYLVLIDRESGGDPDAVNNWDSNAKAGHPSKGLTQTIQGTFLSNFKEGNEEDMTDPQASVVASMRYVMNRYGVKEDGSNLAANVQQANPHTRPLGY
ncbi:transglycosylase SLT domain-containing protein [Nocardia tengchongensis]|uniref:transglycosylase SLT domain-containing protein n=1 Tax=Nocardia tengchongensis TaxID=2055889 RepID=UPI003614C8F8